MPRHQQPYRRCADEGTVRFGPQRRDQCVDEIAVERAMAGDWVQVTILERGVAIARLTRQGMAGVEIARRLGVSRRTVHRYRSGAVVFAREAAQYVGRRAA